MGYLIEYDGDDTTILHKAIEWVANRPSAQIARVTLRPSATSRPSDITSVADYVLSGYLPRGTVLLTLFDEHEQDNLFRHPNGAIDQQRVQVDDIAEIHFY